MQFHSINFSRDLFFLKGGSKVQIKEYKIHPTVGASAKNCNNHTAHKSDYVWLYVLISRVSGTRSFA